MKITDVQAYLLAIPLKEVDFPAPWVWGAFNQIMVEISTDEGFTGYGEAFGYGVPQGVAAVINHTLRPMLIGSDPRNINSLSERMFRQTHIYGRYGITTFAISGVDIALWDIAGKWANLPVYQLLGGTSMDKVPTYASLVRYNNQNDLKAAILHARKAGYDMMKLHQLEVESLKTARLATGEETRLTMDVNCAWNLEEAIEQARKFAPYRLFWLEEPIYPPEDFRSLARLYQLSGTPLASGENACTVFQFREMLEAGAARFIQPSAIKVGGISEWRKINALAEVYNVRINPHSPYFGPGLLATAHLLATSPQADFLEYLYVNLEASVFKDPPRFDRGYMHLPKGPGLGLEIDPAVLKYYRQSEK
jgi:L-alanine-DL-glutamate epimerase-like enolase superfamily enzyme